MRISDIRFMLRDAFGTVMAIVTVTVGVTACGGDTAFAPSADAHALLSAVRFDERAYNMSVLSPYDTVHMHATGVMADGTLAQGTVTYTTSDSSVTVDSTGFVRVYTPTPPPFQLGSSLGFRVYASMTVNGITRRDSAVIKVFPDKPPTPKRLTCRVPVAGMTKECADTTIVLSVGGSQSIGSFALSLRDSIDAFAGNFVIAVTSSDTLVLNMPSNGRGFMWSDALGFVELYNTGVMARDTGSAWLHVSVKAFDRVISDSVRVVVREPSIYRIQSGCDPCIDVGTVHQAWHFYPTIDTVPAGSDVVWSSPAPVGTDTLGPILDVMFDEPQYALESSIPPFITNGEWTQTSAGFGQNEHGGSGNIAPFRAVYRGDIDLFAGRFLLNGAEARRFVRRGSYSYRSSNGASGTVVVR